MIYVIAALCFVICMVAIIFALKVFRENRSLNAPEKEEDDDRAEA